MVGIIPESNFQFLKNLKENNNRDWMQEHKSEYLEAEVSNKNLFGIIKAQLEKEDVIDKLKVFRINRDIRFSKDKTPYNFHRSASFSRVGAERRGGYYLRLEPGNSFLAGGFFNPNPADLLRIRKEFELDGEPIRKILNQPKFKKAFGGFDTENRVKTSPKGFDKETLNLDLIRLKSFIVRHSFTDDEIFSENFKDNVIEHYKLLRPFFDYMSEVLTTDLNGESII